MAETQEIKRRALVSGATGYIGSNLAKRLVVDGWDVHVIVRANSRLNALDSRRSSMTIHEHDGTTQGMIQLVSNAQPDMVFHLASLFLAQHQPEDVEALITSNLLFSTQLVEAMAANQVKYLINTSTSWQHYNNEDYNPVCLYAATKQAFEDILTYYTVSTSIKAVTLQLFDTYGPNDPRHKLFHLLAKTAKSQEALAMSPGEQLIDLVYIDDVIEAYRSAARQVARMKNGHQVYAVSSGCPLKLKELVALYEQIIETSLPIEWGKRPYREREVMLPWNRGKVLEGWTPTISLAEGIRRIV